MSWKRLNFKCWLLVFSLSLSGLRVIQLLLKSRRLSHLRKTYKHMKEKCTRVRINVRKTHGHLTALFILLSLNNTWTVHIRNIRDLSNTFQLEYWYTPTIAVEDPDSRVGHLVPIQWHCPLLLCRYYHKGKRRETAMYVMHLCQHYLIELEY